MLHGAKGQLTEIYSTVSQLMNDIAQHEGKEQESKTQTVFVQVIREILRLVKFLCNICLILYD